MPVEVFSYRQYKLYLEALIQAAEPRHGYVSKLAKAALCQRSYLSQVVHGSAHLTPDHGLGLCRFLRLSDEETDYFFLLLDHARAASPALQERINAKIEARLKERADLAKRVEAKTVDITAQETRYYSSWHWMALHLVVSIPGYQTLPAIAERLNLSESFVLQGLEQLRRLNYVEKREGRWIYSGDNLHLSRESPSVTLHHNNWRQRGVLDSAMTNLESVHYTSVFSLSLKDQELLRSRILSWIDESRKIIGPSSSEELVCFCLDFFKV